MIVLYIVAIEIDMWNIGWKCNKWNRVDVMHIWLGRVESRCERKDRRAVRARDSGEFGWERSKSDKGRA